VFRSVVAAAVAVCLLVASAGAMAEAPPALGPSNAAREQAKAHFRAGRALVEARRYEAAIEEFDKGYALEPLPGFLFNAGSVARMANQYERAIGYFARFLSVTDDGPETAERRDARAWVEEMRRALARSAPAVTSPAPPRVAAQPRSVAAPATATAPNPAMAAATVTATANATGTATATATEEARRRTRRRLAIGFGVVGGLLVVGGVAAAIAVPLSSAPAGPAPGAADWGTIAVSPR
jgi:iron complex outermembrane receptor protein